MKLTKAEIRAIRILKSGSTTYGPGDAIYKDGKNIQRNIVCKLIEKKLARTYDLYPYGEYPIYGLALTEEGKKIDVPEEVFTKFNRHED